MRGQLFPRMCIFIYNGIIYNITPLMVEGMVVKGIIVKNRSIHKIKKCIIYNGGKGHYSVQLKIYYIKWW